MKSSRLKSSSSLSFFGLVWMMQQRLWWRIIKRALLISLLISTRRFNQTFTSWSSSERSTESRWSNRWKIQFDLYQLLFILSGSVQFTRGHFTWRNYTFVRSGFPEELVSDKGRQFVCGESEAFLKSCGIKHIRVFPYYARSNGRLEENFRAAISEGKSWQTESPRNSCATEQIGFKLVEDHLVCFCSIANFEQNSIIGTRSRTLVKMQFVANAFEGISR